MDRYESFIHKGLYSKKYDQSNILKITLSHDNFANFLKECNEGKFNYTLLDIKIYDEKGELNDNDKKIIKDVLLKLNELNINKAEFNLCDETLPFYNVIMFNHMWRHNEKTVLKMSIDRKPAVQKDLKLSLAQGIIALPEEKLLWEKWSTMQTLNGKVDWNILNNTKKLQVLILNFYSNLNKLFYYKDLSEAEKAWLAYYYVRSRIKYVPSKHSNLESLSATNNAVSLLMEPNSVNTYKKGDLTGQSRLMRVLLNNPYIKSDTTTIKGMTPDGYQEWVGTVIDDKLFQSCPAKKEFFTNLDAKGYDFDYHEQYPLIYMHCYNDWAEDKIKQHVLQKVKK